MATLKISDLSVGDWVKINDKPRKVSVIADTWDGKSEALVGYLRHEWPNGYKEVNYKSIEVVEPIPITAEILEKNGFKKSSNYWTAYHDNGDYVEIYNDGDEWDLSVNSVEYILCPLHWVHQIQHLLRVWGIDKEINL